MGPADASTYSRHTYWIPRAVCRINGFSTFLLYYTRIFKGNLSVIENEHRCTPGKDMIPLLVLVAAIKMVDRVAREMTGL